MQRYLLFPEALQTRSPNPLTDYELVDTTLLPAHFGSVASVNIFLGENNSGKSRFMREIMRNKDVLTIDISNGKEQIEHQLSLLNKYIFNPQADIKFSFTFYVTDYRTSINNSYLLSYLSDISYSGNGHSILTKDIGDTLQKVEIIINELKPHIFNHESLTTFAFSNFSDTIERLAVLEKDFNQIFRLFSDTGSNSVLGNNFGHQYNYSLGRHGMLFTLDGATLAFSKYPWGDVYDNELRDKYLLKAANEAYNFLTGITSLKNILEKLLNTRTNPQYRTYIPTLRTARTLITQDGSRLESTNDIFLHTTTHDYSLADTGVIVDTGFSLYDAIDTTRNARHGGRTSFKSFEEFLSTTFFNGKTVEVVAERVRNERGGNIIVAVEGVERDIHDLGDGIQAIIMLLYPLFIAPKQAWFFIEEPEVHLHPGFQRLFIETITSNKVLRDKHLTIFLTTHSNHILDFALDDPSHVNIFTFRRREGVGNKSTYQIQLSSQRDIENLNVLGVRNSSVFLANCSIWVEGISDRLYFRAYLQAYLTHLAQREKDPKTVSLLEGLHYTFLEYAGGNISHFDFTTQQGAFTTQTIENIKSLSISNRIMLVADLDDGKKTRHEARTDQEHTGFKYIVLTVKEVENMLSPELLARGLKKLFQSRNFDPHILAQAEYRTRYLGSYLQEKYPGFPASFIAGSGTIGSNYKRPLAEAVAANLKWEEMSPAAQKFTETLYRFIMDHNPRLGSN